MNGQEIAAATAFPNPSVRTAITSTSDTSASSKQEPTPIQTMQTCPTLVTRDDANAVPSLTPEQGSGYFFLPTRLLMPTTQPQTEEREVIEISDTDDEPSKKGPGRRKKRAASNPTAELRRSRRRTGEANYAEVRQRNSQGESVRESPSKRSRGGRGGRLSTSARTQSLPTYTPRIVRNIFSVDSSPSTTTLPLQLLPPSSQPFPPRTPSPPQYPPQYPVPLLSQPPPPATQPCISADLTPQQRITHNLQALSQAISESNSAFVRGLQAYDLVSHDLAWLKMRYSGVGARVNDYARWLAQMARWANVNALGIQNAIKEGRGEVPLTELPEVRARRQGGAREL
ncbi:related to TSR3 - protein required for processing of the 20S pre-rRNA [Ustilago sp. UG-2017b]|nr:related to TSR3 - protein required for processing of the 20S pre-rRNA [Ustilago sp. UG-2017b]